MKNINTGHFKPSDLFNIANDEEEKVYLAEYNLLQDQNKKIE